MSVSFTHPIIKHWPLHGMTMDLVGKIIHASLKKMYFFIVMATYC